MLKFYAFTFLVFLSSFLVADISSMTTKEKRNYTENNIALITDLYDFSIDHALIFSKYDLADKLYEEKAENAYPIYDKDKIINIDFLIKKIRRQIKTQKFEKIKLLEIEVPVNKLVARERAIKNEVEINNLYDLMMQELLNIIAEEGIEIIKNKKI